MVLTRRATGNDDGIEEYHLPGMGGYALLLGQAIQCRSRQMVQSVVEALPPDCAILCARLLPRVAAREGNRSEACVMIQITGPYARNCPWFGSNKRTGAVKR